jgi:hypothetical protein
MRRLAWLLALIAVSAAAEPVWVGRFNAATATPPAPWHVEHWSDKYPPTLYRVKDWDGVAAVESEAHKSMALLAREVSIDLDSTPMLCWRWRVDAPLLKADLMTKAGDDYAARVYLSYRVASEHLSFGTRAQLALARTIAGQKVPDAAVSYIWDNRYPVGTVVPSTYTDRTRMWVLRTGAAEAGKWVAERRDVLADFQQAFGHAPLRLTGIAVATDTDNTGEDARAGFADLHFVAREAACAF